MMITIVLFTYRGEEELLPIQLAHLSRVLPAARVHVFDDVHDAIPDRVAEQLRERHPQLRWHTTQFNRQGNLNGQTCILGMLDAMESAVSIDGNKDGCVIKLDSDTLILKPQAIVEPFSRGCRWFAANSEEGLYSGMCYAMSVDTIKKVRNQALSLDWADLQGAPEDITIMSLAAMVTGRQPHHHCHIRDPRIAPHIGAFDVESASDPVAYKTAIDTAARSTLVTVGNTGIKGQPRAYRVRYMADILNAFNSL